MQNKLYQHFCRYVAITSQSDASQTVVPSTPGQYELAKQLKSDLQALGLSQIILDEQAILTARLPSNLPYPVQSVGFIAHLDTVDVNLSPEIHPQLIRDYDGKDICLHPEKKHYLNTQTHPEILQYIGDDILCSDGTSVLGADNKAAIAAIRVALEEIINNQQPHGDIYVCFVPDEEIGLRGVKQLDLKRFPVDYAYTIDCCELGEIVYQTFNACTATLTIEGVSAHPMSAKGVLVNPTQIAVDMVNLLDRLQTPENTDHTEGFIWPEELHSNQSTATLNLHIRDHNQQSFQEKKRYIQSAVDLTRLRYPRATIELTLEDTYGNINDYVNADNKIAIDHLYKAMEKLGIEPKTLAMRGGTDGSYLSSQGILTPNFFTGAHNFHSNCEFLPMRSFEKSCRMILTLCELISQPTETPLKAI